MMRSFRLNDIPNGASMTNLTKSNDEFPARLRLRRLVLNVPQHALARKLGVSQDFVSRVETGRRALTPADQRKFEQALERVAAKNAKHGRR